MIEPADRDAFRRAPASVRKAYYTAAGDLILAELIKQLGKGIGANGRRMRVRKQAILADGADGPVMEPHYDASRVITLADYMATDHSLRMFWHAGTGHATHRRARKQGKKATPFGEILDYHAQGLVPHAPARDVRLSNARIANVRQQMRPWWARYGPKPTPTPAAQPTARPSPFRLPQPSRPAAARPAARPPMPPQRPRPTRGQVVATGALAALLGGAIAAGLAAIAEGSQE